MRPTKLKDDELIPDLLLAGFPGLVVVGGRGARLRSGGGAVVDVAGHVDAPALPGELREDAQLPPQGQRATHRRRQALPRPHGRTRISHRPSCLH